MFQNILSSILRQISKFSMLNTRSLLLNIIDYVLMNTMDNFSSSSSHLYWMGSYRRRSKHDKLLCESKIPRRYIH